MFSGSSFNNSLNINTSSVTDMSYMFMNNRSFNQIIDWDTSSVTNMAGMFSSAVLFNQDLSGWNVSSVTNCWEFDNNTPVWTENKPNFNCH
jgi:surface protein